MNEALLFTLTYIISVIIMTIYYKWFDNGKKDVACVFYIFTPLLNMSLVLFGFVMTCTGVTILILEKTV